MKQNRFKSPVLWASFVMLVVNHFGLQAYLGIENHVLQTILDAVIQLLIVAGILNNPVNKNNF